MVFDGCRGDEMLVRVESGTVVAASPVMSDSKIYTKSEYR